MLRFLQQSFRIGSKSQSIFGAFQKYKNNKAISDHLIATTKPFSSYNCRKIDDDILELKETLGNNYERMKSMIEGRELNVTAFLFDCFSQIQHPDMEFYNLIFKNLEKQIPETIDTETLALVIETFNRFRCIPEIFPPIPRSLLKQTAERVKEIYKLYDTYTLTKIQDIFLAFKSEQIDQIDDLLKTIDSKQTNDDKSKIEALLNGYGLESLSQKISKDLEITKLDWDKGFVELNFKKQNQRITIFGCRPFPSNSLDMIKEFIANPEHDISLLILEDSPVIIPKDNTNDAIQNFILDARIHDNYEGDELVELVDLYTKSQDIFKFDPSKNLVYTRVNSNVSIPNEIGTIIQTFYSKQSSQRKKIILADQTFQETISEMAAMFSLKQLEETCQILNLCILAEKLRFAHYSRENGCSQCNPNLKNQLIPKDMISIIAGDKEYPLAHRTYNLADNIIYRLFENPDHKHVLVAVGSYKIGQLIKSIFEVYKTIKGQKPEMNRETLSKIKILSLSKMENKDEMLKKTAILECIHNNIDSAMAGTEGFESEKDYQDYVSLLDQYGYELSYEKLARNNSDVKISPGSCIADSLIFGEGEETLKGAQKENEEVLKSQKIEMNDAPKKISLKKKNHNDN